MSKKRGQDELEKMGSVAGVLLSIIEALVVLVREFGGTFADFHRLTTPEGADDLKAIAAIIAGAKKTVGKSFKDLLAACKQTWVDPRFNADNFPLEPVVDDEDEWEVRQYVFEWAGMRQGNLRSFFNELACLGYRLCGVRRAMEYIADGHLNAQLTHKFLIPVSWLDSETRYWFIPLLCNDSCSGSRILELCELDCRYTQSSNVVFLVLQRKEVK